MCGGGVSDLLWGFFMLFAPIFTMFHDNIKLALIVLLTFPLIIALSIHLRTKILKAQRRVRAVNAQLTAAYNEDIQGAKTTKTLVREALNAQEFFAKTEDMKAASIRGILLSSILTQFNAPLAGAASLFAELMSAQAAAERIFALLEKKPDIRDTEEVIRKYGTVLNPTEAPRPAIKGTVQFDHVSFWYKESEPVLTDFNLTVQAGETLALVGSTGAGKSTIVNLFCRFYEPYT